MPSGSRQALPVGVDRLQPGDHAFLAYCDDEERWEILTVFTRQGFARDEKVFLRVDVAHSPEDVAARVAGGPAAARAALEKGQLVVTSTPLNHDAFDPGRLVAGVQRTLGGVLREGYSGLRSATEMSWSLAPAAGWDQIVEYENALHDSLFTVGANSRCTALCHWNQRQFGGNPVMDTVRAIHPVTVLDRIGTLHVAATAAGIRLAGDGDVLTRDEFTAALHALGERPEATLVLDITDLSFLDAYGAGAILRLAAGLVPPRRLELRCRSFQRRLLHVVGGRSVRQLSIVTQRL